MESFKEVTKYSYPFTHFDNIKVKINNHIKNIHNILSMKFPKCTLAFTGGCLQNRPANDYDIIVSLHNYSLGSDRTKFIKELLNTSGSNYEILQTVLSMYQLGDRSNFTNIKLKTVEGYIIDLLITDESIEDYIKDYPLSIQQVAYDTINNCLYTSTAYNDTRLSKVINALHNESLCSISRYNKVLEKYTIYYKDTPYSINELPKIHALPICDVSDIFKE